MPEMEVMLISVLLKPGILSVAFCSRGREADVMKNNCAAFVRYTLSQSSIVAALLLKNVSLRASGCLRSVSWRAEPEIPALLIRMYRWCSLFLKAETKRSMSDFLDTSATIGMICPSLRLPVE